ncbi:RluA family pseudouridine synthase [Mycoplasmopsis fermentans]|uniref:RluA family pseudouridine synthase n=1 Tax=Mycoplasmopsis fermentans TaxID=2115 RepID=UPI0001E33053|nr:RluA family pseudouridine synthase [Mycoplasmopsis fermentans]ADN69378.1 pseudouridylate synthase [Mycoplasmopsis fermentans JER]RMX34662.1 pseudouridine synthase, RluA family protein [Mycoplasmopsis fermentans MF-I2]
MLKISVQYKERIDKYIGQNSELSRNDIKELIEQGAVYINDNVQVHKCNYIVREGQEITIVKLLDKEIKIEPVNIPLDIKYEDDDLVIINKPSNLVVHPSPGHYNDTLVNGLLYHFKNNLSNENGLLRPGIVHRIDKDTSGLLIIAKNNKMHNSLTDMLKRHEIERSYLAIVRGLIENPLTKINLPIARNTVDRKMMSVHKEGKEAITFVHLLKHFYLDKEPMSLVRCELKTGRTHQIRVHLSYIKHPVYGDPTYGKSVDEFNQRLHAYKLKFIHPLTKKEICVYAPVPKEFDVADYDFNELLKNNVL